MENLQYIEVIKNPDLMQKAINVLNEVFSSMTKTSQKFNDDTKLYNKFFKLNCDTKKFIYLQLSKQLKQNVTREHIVEFMRTYD